MIQKYRGYLTSKFTATGMLAQLVKKHELIQNSAHIDNPRLTNDMINQMVISQFDALPKAPYFATAISTEEQYIIINSDSPTTINITAPMITARKKWKFLAFGSPGFLERTIKFAGDIDELEVLVDSGSYPSEIIIEIRNCKKVIFKHYFGAIRTIYLKNAAGVASVDIPVIEQYFYYTAMNDSSAVLIKESLTIATNKTVIEKCFFISCYIIFSPNFFKKKIMSGGTNHQLELQFNNCYVIRSMDSYLPVNINSGKVNKFYHGYPTTRIVSGSDGRLYTNFEFNVPIPHYEVDWTKSLTLEVDLSWNLVGTPEFSAKCKAILSRTTDGVWSATFPDNYKTNEVRWDEFKLIRAFVEPSLPGGSISVEIRIIRGYGTINPDLKRNYSTAGMLVIYSSLSTVSLNYQLTKENYEDSVLHSSIPTDRIGGVSKEDVSYNPLAYISPKLTNCLLRHGPFSEAIYDISQKINCLYAPTIIYRYTGINPDFSYIYSETPEIYRCTYANILPEMPFEYIRDVVIYESMCRYNIDNFLTLASKRSQNQALSTLVNIKIQDSMLNDLLRKTVWAVDTDKTNFLPLNNVDITESNAVLEAGLPAKITYSVAISENMLLQDYLKKINPNDDFLFIERPDITELLKYKHVDGSTIYNDDGSKFILDFAENFFIVVGLKNGAAASMSIGCILQNRIIPSILSNGMIFISPNIGPTVDKTILKAFQIWQTDSNNLTNSFYTKKENQEVVFGDRAPSSGVLQFNDLTYRYAITSYTIL